MNPLWHPSSLHCEAPRSTALQTVQWAAHAEKHKKRKQRWQYQWLLLWLTAKCHLLSESEHIQDAHVWPWCRLSFKLDNLPSIRVASWAYTFKLEYNGTDCSWILSYSQKVVIQSTRMVVLPWSSVRRLICTSQLLTFTLVLLSQISILQHFINRAFDVANWTLTMHHRISSSLCTKTWRQ